MKTFQRGGRTVSVNDTAEDVLLMPDRDVRQVVETWLSELTSLSPAMRRSIDNPANASRHNQIKNNHAAFTKALLEQHAQGFLLLSPTNFTTGTDERVANRVVRQILENSPLGRSIVHELGAVGLYGFIEKLQPAQQVTYRNLLDRIMASLCMSVIGVDRIEDLPPEAYLAWLGFFRNDTNTRYRQEIWNSCREVAFQCIRELTYAYARKTGHNKVALNATQKRSDSKNLLFWADIERKPPDHIRPWVTLFNNWRVTRPSFAKTYRQMFMHLVKWMNDHFAPDDVADIAAFISRPDRKPSFADFLIEKRSHESGKQPGLTFIQTLQYAMRFSEFIGSEFATKGEGQRIYHLVTATDIERAKNVADAGGRSHRAPEAKSRPLPMRFYQITREILKEGEQGWPGTSGFCTETVTRADGTSEEVYCPVLPTLFLSLFHLPLRVGQMKRFDSGEGDVTRFDGATLSWGANEGTNAGYWRHHAVGGDNHGYAHRFDSKPVITGFFVNTNKTGVPYVVPWQNEELHKLLYDLRLWQERNNPCKSPIGPEFYIDGVEELDEGKLEDYPEIFSLFRLPVARRSGRQGCPPNARRTNEFWQQLMAETERRWNASNPPEEHVQLVKRQEKTGQPYAAKYNPHGLRVAGLTLMFHQKVPIEVISKLVAGHKTIVMTLYYLKFDPVMVHQALDEAARGREAAEAQAWIRDLKVAKFEAAQTRAACIQEDGLRAATSMDATDKVCWSDTGIGICPWDGKRCGDGGPCIRKDKRLGGASDVHGPVVGGERNCILCRHFITGPAWLTPLWLYGTKLTRQFASKSERIAMLNQELEELHSQYQVSTDASARQRLSKALGQRRVEADAVAAELDIVAEGIWNTQKLIDACHKVERIADLGSDGNSSALVAQDRDSVVEYLEANEFEQAAIITAGSRVYPILHDAEAEAARDRFLDTIMWNSGGQPLTFTPLDPAIKRRGQDALSRLLLERVEREEIAALASGAMRLQDLHLEDEVAAAITAAIGSPISIAGAGRPALIGAREAVA